MPSFQINKNVAILEVTENGFRVTVTVERKDGITIETEDAEIALTKAMRQFPQRTRSS